MSFRSLLHTGILVSLLGGGAAHPQSLDDPFTDPGNLPAAELDPFAAAEDRENNVAGSAEPRITLLAEYIQLSQHDWIALSQDDSLALDDNALRKRVGEMMKSDHATLLDMSLITGMSGERFLNESFQFQFYPASFDPPQIDEKNGRVVPASFASTECRNAGISIEGTLVLSADGKTVDLTLLPEMVEVSGENTIGEGDAEVRTPRFKVHKISSNLAVAAGDFALAGVMHSLVNESNDRPAEVILLFLRASVHTPRLAKK